MCNGTIHIQAITNATAGVLRTIQHSTIHSNRNTISFCRILVYENSRPAFQCDPCIDLNYRIVLIRAIFRTLNQNSSKIRGILLNCARSIYDQFSVSKHNCCIVSRKRMPIQIDRICLSIGNRARSAQRHIVSQRNSTILGLRQEVCSGHTAACSAVAVCPDGGGEGQRHDQRQNGCQYLFHITYPGFFRFPQGAVVLILIKTGMQEYSCG